MLFRSEITNQEAGKESNISYLKMIAEKIGKGINRSNQVIKDMSVDSPSEETVFFLLKALETAEEATNNKISDANVNLDITEIPKDQKIRFSEGKLSQILINLITNACDAIRTSGFGDTIKITSRYKNSELVLFFEDNGPGVPEKIRSKIFDPYFTTKGVGEGTGVGLYITKSLLGNGKDDGHSIELLDRDTTCFKLTFRGQVFDPQKSIEVKKEKFSQKSLPENSSAKPVLIVIEPDSQVRKESKAIHSENCEVHIFDRAKPALKQLERLKPNLILLEIDLPDLDISHINKLFRLFPDLNIYVQSGLEYDYAVRKKGLDVPRNRFIEKCIDINRQNTSKVLISKYRGDKGTRFKISNGLRKVFM